MVFALRIVASQKVLLVLRRSPIHLFRRGHVFAIHCLGAEGFSPTHASWTNENEFEFANSRLVKDRDEWLQIHGRSPLVDIPGFHPWRRSACFLVVYFKFRNTWRPSPYIRPPVGARCAFEFFDRTYQPAKFSLTCTLGRLREVVWREQSLGKIDSFLAVFVRNRPWSSGKSQNVLFKSFGW